MKIQHEPHCRLGSTKTRSQTVITATAPDSSPSAFDINFESQTSVVIEPGYVPKIDFEAVRQLQRLDHGPQTLETIERSLRAWVCCHPPRVIQNFALARKLNKLREGP